MCAHVRTFCPTGASAMIAPMSQRFPLGGGRYGVKDRRRRGSVPGARVGDPSAYARDPKFEEICEDYRDALVELRHWEGAGPAGATRAEDFRRILDELEAEILGILDGPRGRRPRLTTAGTAGAWSRRSHRRRELNDGNRRGMMTRQRQRGAFAICAGAIYAGAINGQPYIIEGQAAGWKFDQIKVGEQGDRPVRRQPRRCLPDQSR